MILKHNPAMLCTAVAWGLRVDMPVSSCTVDHFVLSCLLVNKVMSSILNTFHKIDQINIK